MVYFFKIIWFHMVLPVGTGGQKRFWPFSSKGQILVRRKRYRRRQNYRWRWVAERKTKQTAASNQSFFEKTNVNGWNWLWIVIKLTISIRQRSWTVWATIWLDIFEVSIAKKCRKFWKVEGRIFVYSCEKYSS